MTEESKLRPAIFLDRDGTINEDIGYASHPEEIRLYPESAKAIRLINQSGLKAILVTNQSGIARGLFSEARLTDMHDHLQALLAQEHARIDAIYFCPHHPRYGDATYRRACDCRKPQPALIYRAVQEHAIDLPLSFVIGDKASDINLAANVGAKSVLVLTGYGNQTLAHSDRWPCHPTWIADNLYEAVKRILDSQEWQR